MEILSQILTKFTQRDTFLDIICMTRYKMKYFSTFSPIRDTKDPMSQIMVQIKVDLNKNIRLVY
jgi:hypothetical protein